MTDWNFENGIRIHLPDNLSNEELYQRWTNTKMEMSILLTDYTRVEPKVRKPYTLTREGYKKRRLIDYHKGQKKK
jgi:hypothetical protein